MPIQDLLKKYNLSHFFSRFEGDYEIFTSIENARNSRADQGEKGVMVILDHGAELTPEDSLSIDELADSGVSIRIETVGVISISSEDQVAELMNRDIDGFLVGVCKDIPEQSIANVNSFHDRLYLVAA